MNFGNPGSAGFIFVLLLAIVAWLSARARKKAQRQSGLDPAEASAICSFCERATGGFAFKNGEAVICSDCVEACAATLRREEGSAPAAETSDTDLPVN